MPLSNFDAFDNDINNSVHLLKVVSPMAVPSAEPTPSLSAITPISEDRDTSSVTPVTSPSHTSTVRVTNRTPDIEKLSVISSGEV